MRCRTSRWLGTFVVIFGALMVFPDFGQYREYYAYGKIVDVQKAPLEGVEVTIKEIHTDLSFTQKTKKDGLFKFPGLSHGTYQVVYKKEGYAVKKDEWKFEKPQDSMQKFEVPPVVLATQEFVQESERMKEAAAGVKDAAEKVKLGDYDTAISKLKAILDKNPKDSNALYIVGMAYLKKKMWPEAISPLLQVVDLSPKFAAAYYQLGVCYQQQKEPQKALEYYQKATDLDPSNPDIPYNSGLILFGLNRIDEALACFEKALNLKPDDPASLEMAGRCYINRSDFQKAIEYLEKAKAGYATDLEKVKFLDDLIAKLKEQIKKDDRFPWLDKGDWK
jgi:tetratricopeptide (TPR) repeat protein